MANVVKLEDLIGRRAEGSRSDAPLPSGAALLAGGWEQRFTADLERVAEVIALYTQLGFEVRAEPLRPSEARDECQECRFAMGQQFKTIYTRKKNE